MKAALSFKPPARDPLEPNDDIPFVTGQVFGKPSRAIWTGGRPERLVALLDRFEDPADVYRIKVPGRSSVRIQVKPDFGNPDLEVYRSGTKTLVRGGGLIASSRRPGGHTDQVKLRNSASGSRTAYVTVYVPRRGLLDSRYALRIK
jgi:hypothetical protein